MGYYNEATICVNGHEINLYRANAQPYCEKCGAKTISFCKHCNQPIHGEYECKDFADLAVGYHKPYYCWNCGKPYPWTERIIENAIEILALDETLSESDREMIKNAIPNLIVETPDTPISVAKYSKGLNNAADFVKSSLRQLLVDVVSETIKKSLFE